MIARASLVLLALIALLGLQARVGAVSKPSDAFHWNSMLNLPNINSYAAKTDEPPVNCLPELKPVALDASVWAPILADVQAAFADLFQKSGFPGASGVITYRDQVIMHWQNGYRNVETKAPVTPSTRFRVASVSKAMTATALFKLISEGIIDGADDPVIKYEPRFAVNNPYGTNNLERTGQQITLKQLASHMSGLQREAPCQMELCNVSTTEMLNRIKPSLLIRPPNQKPSYSNLGYALLGNLLSDSILRGAKGPYHQMIKTLVLDVLGMNESGFYPSEADLQDFATGYNNAFPIPFYNVDWLNPSGGLFLSANDAAKWMIDLMRQGDADRMGDSKLMDSATLRQFFQTLFVNSDNVTGFSAPWEIARRYQFWAQEKGGALVGFSSIISMIPELRLGIAVFGNAGGSTDKWTKVAHSIIIPRLLAALETVQPGVPLVKRPELYVGNYIIKGAQGNNPVLISTIQATRANPNLLYMTIVGMSTFVVPQDAVDPSRNASILQISVPAQYNTCFVGEALGFDGQYLHFDLGPDPVNNPLPALGFNAQGLGYGLVYTRIKQ